MKKLFGFFFAQSKTELKTGLTVFWGFVLFRFAFLNGNWTTTVTWTKVFVEPNPELNQEQNIWLLDQHNCLTENFPEGVPHHITLHFKILYFSAWTDSETQRQINNYWSDQTELTWVRVKEKKSDLNQTIYWFFMVFYFFFFFFNYWYFSSITSPCSCTRGKTIFLSFLMNSIKLISFSHKHYFRAKRKWG